ncbi:MAG TPA: YfhO family protein [Saprospiraceae bacterium]|nr:YfhO family protein [Saprospiraceae bacterium]
MLLSKNQLQTIGLFSIILFGLLYFFRNYIFGRHLFLFDDIGNDSLSIYYPRLLEFLHLAKEGFPTTWSFHKGIGANSFDNNMMDFTNWPRYLLDAKSQASYILYRQLFRIGVSAIFIYHYFKLLPISAISRSIGTILYTFCGYMTLTASWYAHTEYMMNFAICLFGIEMLLQKNKWWPLSLGMVLIFSPKIVFFFEFCVIYYLLRIVSESDFSLSTFKKHTVSVLKSGLLAFLLLGPFLGSMIYEVIYSPRVGGDVGYNKELSSNPVFGLGPTSEYWTAALRFFSNDFLGSGNKYIGYYNYLEGPNFYIGLITLLVFTQAFTLFSKKKKIIFGSVLLFWALLVTFPYLRHAFYFFSGNYYKGAVSIFLPFTFLYIAIMSLDAILKEQKVNLLLLWASFLALVTLLFFGNSINEQISGDIAKMSGVFLFIYAVIFTFFAKTKMVKGVSYALFAIIFLELMYMGNITLNSRLDAAPTKTAFKKRIGHNDYSKEAVDYVKSLSKPFYRIEKAFGSYKTGFNDASAQGYFSTKSYDSFNHNHYITFLKSYKLLQGDKEENTRWVMGLVSSFYVHPFFSTKYFFTTPTTDIYVSKAHYRPIKTLNGINIYQNVNYIPFGIPIENYFTTSAFEKLKDETAIQMSLYENIVVEDKDLPLVSQLKPAKPDAIPFPSMLSYLSEGLSKKAMKMESFTNNKITGSIDITKPSVVVFSMPFDAGWHAKIDGKKSPLIKVDAGLTGLPITTGKHKIELHFIPPFLYLGCVLALLGIGLLVYTIYLERRKSALN